MTTYYLEDLTRLVRIKVLECDCGCWYWLGSCDSHGYAKMKLRQRTIQVHRYAYERLVADIPEGMTIDHLSCTSRRCINPEHMQVITRSLNSERANATRWHDLKFDADGVGHLHDACRACWDRDQAPRLRPGNHGPNVYDYDGDFRDAVAESL